MFELLHEGVVVIDTNNMIRMANPAFERMFGFAPGAAVDTSIEDLMRSRPAYAANVSISSC